MYDSKKQEKSTHFMTAVPFKNISEDMNNKLQNQSSNYTRIGYYKGLHTHFTNNTKRLSNHNKTIFEFVFLQITF